MTLKTNSLSYSVPVPKEIFYLKLMTGYVIKYDLITKLM